MKNATRKGYLITFLTLAAMGSALAGYARAGEHDVSSTPSQIPGISRRSANSGVVPISVESGEIIVDVTIDGKGPFPMMFDTGSVGAVTLRLLACWVLRSKAATQRAAVGRLVSPLHSLASKKCGSAAQNC